MRKTFAGRLLIKVAKTLLVIFVLLNIMLAFHSWKFTHFYDDPELRKPQQSSFLSTLGFIVAGNRIPKRLNDAIPIAPFETVLLTTNDGLQLEAWDIACTGLYEDSLAMLRSSLNYHRGTIIMFHGHASCKSAILPEAYEFLKLGYHVLMVDFRAHGGSTGQQCMIGMKESADVKAAYDYVVAKNEKNILLYGVSMGAAAILRTMNDYEIQPSGLVLEMPFATMADATKGKLSMMHLPTALAPLLVFWGGTLNGEWAFGYQPYKYAAKIKCPVLLQWGRHDPRVAETETNAIYNNIPTEKQLVVYENSGHQSLCKNEHEKWMKHIRTFLK